MAVVTVGHLCPGEGMTLTGTTAHLVRDGLPARPRHGRVHVAGRVLSRQHQRLRPTAPTPCFRPRCAPSRTTLGPALGPLCLLSVTLRLVSAVVPVPPGILAVLVPCRTETAAPCHGAGGRLGAARGQEQRALTHVAHLAPAMPCSRRDRPLPPPSVAPCLNSLAALLLHVVLEASGPSCAGCPSWAGCLHPRLVTVSPPQPLGGARASRPRFG